MYKKDISDVARSWVAEPHELNYSCTWKVIQALVVCRMGNCILKSTPVYTYVDVEWVLSTFNNSDFCDVSIILGTLGMSANSLSIVDTQYTIGSIQC